MDIILLAISWLSTILCALILIRSILSWFQPRGGGGSLSQMLFTLTEPILAPIRNLIARSPLGGQGMMIDFSPLIAILLIGLVSKLLSMLVVTIF